MKGQLTVQSKQDYEEWLETTFAAQEATK
jgi:heme/copper-type cytochrome/quinol oxidase subunit 2